MYKNTKVSFLHLVDTRGYELCRRFNADWSVTEISEYIKMTFENNKDGNPCNFVHCIWF